MAYKYLDKVDNIHLLDTHFLGFPRYHAAYVVKGEEKTILIDTGDPKQLEIVRKEMARVGVTMKDIDYIFITHEHSDHAGNAASLALENPDVIICINPLCEEAMTHPEIEAAGRERLLPPGMADRFGTMLPADPGQLYFLKDGEEFDIGGDILKVIFTPGHQPGGLVIEESKNKLLFINDLNGMYLAESGVALTLTPPNSWPADALASLRKIENNDYKWVAMGHYGFCNDPDMVIQGAIRRIERLLAIAEKCDAEGKLDELRKTIMEQVIQQEIDKLQPLSDKALYTYFRDEFGYNLCNGFALFYEKYREGGNR